MVSGTTGQAASDLGAKCGGHACKCQEAKPSGEAGLEPHSLGMGAGELGEGLGGWRRRRWGRRHWWRDHPWSWLALEGPCAVGNGGLTGLILIRERWRHPWRWLRWRGVLHLHPWRWGSVLWLR